MSQIAVIGGGMGGIFSALRLARMGHAVALLERAPVVGGALTPVSKEGFVFDSGPAAWLMPHVLRDLFEESGRSLVDELGGELEPAPVLREHRFADHSTLRLPGGSSAAQKEAFDELAPGLGQMWIDYVEPFAAVWETIGPAWFESATPTDELPQQVTSLLRDRSNLSKHLHKRLRDERVELISSYPFVCAGQDPRNVPTWLGVHAYLEQQFGGWRVPGGNLALLAALHRRLALREVKVMTDLEALDVVVNNNQLIGVRTLDGLVEADAVVCAIDPRRLPALAPHVEQTMPALPGVSVHLGLADVPAGVVDPLADVDHELVFHGDATISLRPGGTAPRGASAWLMQIRGQLSEDPLRTLLRSGIDLRDRALVQLERTPRSLVEEWGGSPWGVVWEGRKTATRLLGPHTPIPGLYVAGAHARCGAGIHNVGYSAAQVCDAIGPAD